ncbi:AMP-binding protein [Variovorax sp. VRV01]|uniref:AMP-binding protein n=1 Tax=Variovorax sp. VRV01 TaxID=2769259 RepID=UPI00178404C1|nr:AMP-binding protein [Variovorax sp. VRV01]MBD9667065.1 AMP-binding protein [Variovorax sp. VRV01]
MKNEQQHLYPSGVRSDIDVAPYSSLVELMDVAFARHAHSKAYTFMGRSFTFGQVDAWSGAFGAYLQSIGLARGDRVALMMPNVPQYPIAVAAVLRAGLVVVNVNPLYTPRELEHQLVDSGAKAIVILENFAATLQAVIARTEVRHTVVATLGDLLGLKGLLVNQVVRKVKKLVPRFTLPNPAGFRSALAAGRKRQLRRVTPLPDELAVLQYTGGTTGVSKGAMLLQRNLVANILQSAEWYVPALEKVPPREQLTLVCALPIYHVFGFTACVMLGLHMGARNILIPNPRDLKAVFKELQGMTFHSFPAVNTLFAAMANHPGFDTVNWRNLVLSVGGGAAVQSGVAALWLEKTGCPICEGYGLSETSPSVTCNPVDSASYTGSIGLPLPNTQIALIDDSGAPVAPGQPGEIAVRGPQVMAGYWRRADETEKCMTPDGFFRTGDIGIRTDSGHYKIVDRKKDMILVSGFNVYPNEIEDVVSRIPGVLECAVVGVPDPGTAEAVKLVVVKKADGPSEGAIRRHCQENLTAYKRPKLVEFRTELPKSSVGKILRRELRAAPT